MDHIKSRLIKISNEIAFFCFELGADSLEISIISKEKNYQIAVQCDIKNPIEEELEKLQEQLNVPRREDIEEYLWELAGENEGSRELSLVGMMIDEVNISYNHPQLNIVMYRNK